MVDNTPMVGGRGGNKKRMSLSAWSKADLESALAEEVDRLARCKRDLAKADQTHVSTETLRNGVASIEEYIRDIQWAIEGK